MQSYLSVNSADLLYNARAAVDYVNTPVIAVVKCNGYGVGLENAVNAWYAAGVRMFAAAESGEALRIAAMGFNDIDILLLSPCYNADELQALAENNVIFTVTSVDCANALVTACSGMDCRLRAHVKVNTGMGRFGKSVSQIDEIKAIYDVSGIDFCGIFSHFALSFENEYNATKKQLDRFLQIVGALADSGIDVGMRHIANSCAAVLYEQTRLDAVRLGSVLVGRLMRSTPLELKPIGRLCCSVADTVSLNKGDTSGYAMIYKAKSEQNCAVIEVGYRYGFGMTRKSDTFRFVDVLRDILHSVKGFHNYDYVVDENGKRHNVVGRIGNQYTLVDNSDLSLHGGDRVYANVNLLFVDSDIRRVLE